MVTHRLALAISTALLVTLAGCASRVAQDAPPEPVRDGYARANAPSVPGSGKDLDGPVPAASGARPLPQVAAATVGDTRRQSVPLATPMREDLAPAKQETRAQSTVAASSALATAPSTPPPGIVTLAPVGQLAAIAGKPAEVQPADAADRERYRHADDNGVVRTAESPVSTFSIDVDTGSYSNARRMLVQGRLPPADAVRAEEFLNYFDYGYAPPASPAVPFSVTTELAPAPWNAKRQLLMVGIQGYEPARSQIPASNLVFLIDTSGSMQSADKIELLKTSFRRMVHELRAQDRVSIVVYAGSAGLVLPPTPGDQHERIHAALDQLQAGGSTNGSAGIELAYATAREAYIARGVNRVILATDGDFNVGTVGIEALKSLVADKRRSGIALTTLGFGQGNYNDELAEQLADVGNGNHFYIDTADEGRKVLVDELGATTMTIAKDVKIQVEFNPAQVAEYRLIGYENRALRREDFNNDAVDAGEIGAGHDVTALYELTLAGSDALASDPLRYGTSSTPAAGSSEELAFLRLRYKRPDEDHSRLLERPVLRRQIAAAPSSRLAFAASVAAFADALRGGKHLSGFGLDRIALLARAHLTDDRNGYRTEFVTLVDRAAALQTPATAQR